MSVPKERKPFSRRRDSNASRPAATMPDSCPAAKIASHSRSPRSAEVYSSQPNSPTYDSRIAVTGIPASVTLRVRK